MDSCGANGRDPFFSYLLHIIKLELKLKYTITHKPLGSENPYLFGPEERKPRSPSERDKTIIGIITSPANRDISLFAKVSINGASPELIKAGWVEDLDRTSRWRIEMPNTQSFDKVEYSFELSEKNIMNEDNRKIFSYTVDGFSSVSSVVSCQRNKNILFLLLKVKHFTFKRAFDFSRSGNIRVTQGNLVPSLNTSGINNISISGEGFKTRINNNEILVLPESGCVTILNNLGETVYSETTALEFRMNAEGNIVSLKNTQAVFGDEMFFGFGERFNSLNQRGNCLDVRVFEEYKSQSEGSKTYLPVPFFLSSGGWGHCINTNRKVTYDLRSDNSWSYEVEMQDLNLECFIYTGTPSEILANQALLSGFPVLPPDWAFGPWMSSNEWNSQERVLKELHKGRGLDIPATVLVIEAWSDEKNFYIWNDARYAVKDGSDCFSYKDFTFPSDGLWPDPKEMIKDIHRDGTRLILWQIPVLKKLEENVTCEQNDNDLRYMIEKKYCVMDGNDEPYQVKPWWFTGSPVIDFTNEEATEWWLKKREYLIDDLDIDGFKTDGGEHLWGRDLRFSDGRTGDELWNEYPKHYISSYFNFINKKNGGITFSRSGFMGVQSSPVHWAGDQDSTWDAHRSVLKAVINTGISGIPFMGWDIGGFSGEIPTAELYLRSAAFACFGSIMQYHSEFYDHRIPHVDRTPWNIAERTGVPEVVDIYRYFAKLRMQLLPYIKKEAENCCKTGEPLMRAMFIDYPDDPKCWTLEDQYKFGRDLIVCPMLFEGEAEREIYLPEGEWYDFFTGKEYAGSSLYNINVPLNRIPVFSKRKSLIESITLPEEVNL